MKIRTDFVTNSSSSFFICIAKIDKTEELVSYMKEEYGNYGSRILDENLVLGSDTRDCYIGRVLDDIDVPIENDAYYLQASFVQWTTEGDKNGDDAFLYDAIPEKYKEVLHEEEY